MMIFNLLIFVLILDPKNNVAVQDLATRMGLMMKHRSKAHDVIFSQVPSIHTNTRRVAFNRSLSFSIFRLTSVLWGCRSHYSGTHLL